MKHIKIINNPLDFKTKTEVQNPGCYLENNKVIFSKNIFKNLSILLKEEVKQNYTLVYSDLNKEPLQDFSPITIQNSEEIQYDSFINENMIPVEAEFLTILDETGNAIEHFNLKNFKKPVGSFKYRFGLFSDVQYGYQDFTKTDFGKGMAFLFKNSVDFNCACGDLTHNGYSFEFKNIRDLYSLNLGEIPLYSCTGNHDTKNENGVMVSKNYWHQYIDGSYNDSDSLNCVVDKGDDHFIFLGMDHQNNGGGNDAYEYSTYLWLKEQLEKYKNDRCFIFIHPYFPQKAGDFGHSLSYNRLTDTITVTNPKYYPNNNWGFNKLSADTSKEKHKYTCLRYFMDLRDSYKNTIWFTGHSHWNWNAQGIKTKNPETGEYMYNKNANIDPCNSDIRTIGWNVHVPSLTCPRDFVSEEQPREEENLDKESQLAIVDVYDNCIVIKGIFKDSKGEFKFMPIGQFLLYT